MWGAAVVIRVGTGGDSKEWYHNYTSCATSGTTSILTGYFDYRQYVRFLYSFIQLIQSDRRSHYYLQSYTGNIQGIDLHTNTRYNRYSTQYNIWSNYLREFDLWTSQHSNELVTRFQNMLGTSRVFSEGYSIKVEVGIENGDEGVGTVYCTGVSGM